MKKAFIFLCMTFALVACNIENPVEDKPGTVDISQLSFQLTINNADDTKAVKSGWESGDQVFVFFNDLTTAYVSYTYGTSGWEAPVVNGTGALATSGKLTAVYLPFKNASDTPNYIYDAWRFSNTFFTYYMVAENVSYTVNTDVNTLSATMNMVNPEGFVQFFIPDESASDGAYTLATDAVIPTRFYSIASDGTITENTKDPGDPMEGYAYEGGYVFTGKLNPGYHYEYDRIDPTVPMYVEFAGNYYFIKTKTADGSREDYFSNAVTLESHMAAKLPANGSEKWIAVGPDQYVDLGDTGFKWATCNYGCLVPEGVYESDDHTFDYVSTIIELPSKIQMENLYKNNTVKPCMIHGQPGLVIKNATTNGFVFLPMIRANNCNYWTSDQLWIAQSIFDPTLLTATSGNGTTSMPNIAAFRAISSNTPKFTIPFSAEQNL